MRKILLAAVALAALVAPQVASAGTACLGFRRSVGFYPPAVLYSSPGYYPAPAYPYAYGYYYPYPYSYSYFRPDGPYGWNTNRNWRDTWQDDGNKVHGYTFR